LVQGVGIVGEGWRPQVEALKDAYTLVSFDNRGIGASELAAGGAISVEAMAEDALAVMDAEAFDRFHLVGHSLGGVIAQEIALRAPHRVKSLALVCTFARGRQGARLTFDILLAGLRTRIGTARMRRRAFLELVMPPAHLAALRDVDAYAEELRPLFGRDLADQPAVAMKQLRAMARHDALARLAGITIPTLVVSASGDRIALPRYGAELARTIPGARFVELQEAGHGVTIHRPLVVNDLLRQHFDQNDR
jgi:pimeloyl-ACP methyl ester carboxylesterase